MTLRCCSSLVVLALLIFEPTARGAIQNVNGCAEILPFSNDFVDAEFRVYTDCGNTKVELHTFLNGRPGMTYHSNTGDDCIAEFDLNNQPVDKVVIKLVPNCTGAFGEVVIDVDDLSDAGASGINCDIDIDGKCLGSGTKGEYGIGSSRECEELGGGCDFSTSSKAFNFNVHSNGLDVLYAGLGNTPGGGLGTWIHGEDLKGTVQTLLGDWGHKQTGWRESACVLTNPGAGGAAGGPALIWPRIAIIEFDGRNGHVGDVFTNPACDPGGSIPGLTSGGFIPYGTPGASSTSFLLAGYPSGLGLPTLTLLLPNGGLVPSTGGGTATLIAATDFTSLLIASTGFCWVVDFQWSPSALASRDDIDGWWHYMHNSPDLNQYWGMSNDEGNAWQSFTVGYDGAGGLLVFFANLDYEYHGQSADPSANPAIQPSGANGTGVYYTTTVDAGGGNPGGGGFDLGRHTAWSQSGTGGSLNPLTGLGNQDPAGAANPGVVPTLSVATWNNENYDLDVVPTGGFRLTWLTLDWDATFGLDPAIAGEAVVFGGAVRVPSTIPASIPTWPQVITSAFWPFLIHDTVNHDGSGAWPDPNGFASGAFGVPGVNGTPIHVPILIGSTCIGSPIALQIGTSGLLGPGGPLTWIPDGLSGFPGVANAASSSSQIYILD